MSIAAWRRIDLKRHTERFRADGVIVALYVRTHGQVHVQNILSQVFTSTFNFSSMSEHPNNTASQPSASGAFAPVETNGNWFWKDGKRVGKHQRYPLVFPILTFAVPHQRRELQSTQI